MERSSIVPIILSALLGACATSAPNGGGAPSSESVAGPGVITLGSGATLAVPAAFEARRKDNVVSLREPDGEVEVHVVELASASDLEGAIRSAWQLVDPAFAMSVEKAVTPPPGDGWDAIRVEQYVVGADRVFAQAVARQHGGTVWVAVLRGPVPSVDKRNAQIRSFLGSLEVPGKEKIDLAGAEPRSIADSIPELEAFIQEALEASKTPGLTIAVVEEGKTVFAKGYGVKEVGKSDPVDADTLMMIGSVSKSMTTLWMAMLVDEGKLRWEAPVTELYPEFRLADAELSKKLQLEHLVCACAGLPRKDIPLILEFEDKRAKNVFAELAGMAPSTGLKETFQYQNHMVAAGGFVAAHAVDPKASMEEVYAREMKRRVFAPLGMERSTLDHDAAIASPNRATPHSSDLTGAHQVVSLEHERFAAYVGPSGGIWSSANEMARYLAMELAGGVAPGGARIVSEANLERRRSPQVAISSDVHYGLGWIVSKERGLRRISHGGGTMGFATLVSFYPEKKRGVVMISNGTGGHLAEGMIVERLAELWFGVDSKSGEKLRFAVDRRNADLAELSGRLAPPEADWVAPFLGKHANPEVGEIELRKQGSDLFLDTGVYETRLLRHARPDGRRELMFADPPLAGLTLVPVEGKPGVLEMVRGQERYVFERR